MSKDEHDYSNDAERPIVKKSKPWFRARRSGLGWTPQTWQGWVILLAPSAAIVVIIVLLRNGSF